MTDPINSHQPDQDEALSEESVAEIQQIVEQCRALLSGRDPKVQGASVTELVAMFIAGHHPEIREQVLDLTIEAVRELVPVTAKALFGETGWVQ